MCAAACHTKGRNYGAAWRIVVMAGAGPASTPLLIAAKQSRGWRAFARHDEMRSACNRHDEKT
jgi:hypothetical protein